MSYSLSDDSTVRPPTFAGLDMHGLSIVHPDLPDSWGDDEATYLLERLDLNAWNVVFDGVVIGVLTHVPPLSLGDAESWKIGDPAQQDLGVGASWSSWEDAVANLVDYRRRR